MKKEIKEEMEVKEETKVKEEKEVKKVMKIKKRKESIEDEIEEEVLPVRHRKGQRHFIVQIMRDVDGITTTINSLQIQKLV